MHYEWQLHNILPVISKVGYPNCHLSPLLPGIDQQNDLLEGFPKATEQQLLLPTKQHNH